MIARRTVVCLSVSQLISWGVSYYLIGGFGVAIAGDLGWRPDAVHGGFALALLVMGLASPLAGRLIDRYGGRRVMAAGAVLNACGCAILAITHGPAAYIAAWLCLGLGMRLSLYDAAFAALVRIGGPSARPSMAQITLLGGLASTVFWPLGHLLSAHLGWRGAVGVYGALSLLTLPLFRAIPESRHDQPPLAAAARPAATGHAATSAAAASASAASAASAAAAAASAEAATPAGVPAGVNPFAPVPIAASGSGARLQCAAGLYVVLTTVANFLNAGMSAHMVAMLSGLGLGASLSVWFAALRGIGQSLARFCEILSGGRLHPLRLNFYACLLMPVAFMLALYAGTSDLAAIVFVFLYGACTGILTITRGTLPLVLFDHRVYGALVGKLIAPGFMLSAAAPVIYASLMEYGGDRWGLYLSIACAVAMFIAGWLLLLLFAKHSRQEQES